MLYQYRRVNTGSDILLPVEFSGGYSRRADRMHSSWADYLEQEVAQNLLRESSSDRGISLEVAQLLQPADTFGVRPVGQGDRLHFRRGGHLQVQRPAALAGSR